MKKVFLLLGGLVVAAALAGGGFYFGMQYQQGLVDQAQSNFILARGEGGGQFPGDGLPMPGGEMPDVGTFGGRGGGMGGGLSGTVKSVDGDTLTLSTAEDVTTVTLSDETVIRLTINGTSADLQAGDRVMVTGETGDDGSLTAVQIQILSSDFPALETTP